MLYGYLMTTEHLKPTTRTTNSTTTLEPHLSTAHPIPPYYY